MIKRFSDAEILQMLGLRFKQYRVALGLTQAELSAKAGVSVMTIHSLKPERPAMLQLQPSFP